MRDILIGLLIIVVCFLIGDYIYSEKNLCSVGASGYQESAKCGMLKQQFDIDINVLGRYW